MSDLINYNQPPKPPVDSQATVEAAQQSVVQTPQQILSSFIPTDTSFFGAAPAVDSLLGNISTSAGLNALSQINATKTPDKQVSPLGDAAQAVSFGQASVQNALTTLLASIGAPDSTRLPSAYYTTS